MVDHHFWKDKRVFITGFTGFKGSWLSIWLHALGAHVTGYALNPPTNPNLYDLCGVDRLLDSVISDILDIDSLSGAIEAAQPEIVVHMAAQPLVRESYKDPIRTYAVNVMGTAYLLECVRRCGSVKAVVNVTTDKCYENREWVWGYRENEQLGGYDPYSSSKACSELVTAAYRNSFFNQDAHEKHKVGVATARAGNVIGGGDWAAERLIPDCLSALLRNERIKIRKPLSVRPWQHVLEPLMGYLMLAQKLYEDGQRFSGAWNFGPDSKDVKPVEWLTQKVCSEWGDGAFYEVDAEDHHPHEAHCLKLDSSKARVELGWSPRWDLEIAVRKIVEWTKEYKSNRDMREVCLRQIAEYSEQGNIG